jgi:hypothetical protein
MNHRMVGASLAFALLVGGVLAADAVKSGPQPGQGVAAFHPLNVTGDKAGQKNCLVWSNGNNPVAMIFAREVSDPLTSLVKKIDAATAKNKSCSMGSFVVFCSDSEGLEKQLKDLASKETLNNTVLTIDNPAGPKGFNVVKDADVTVVLYKNKKVVVNHAFKKGELKDQDIEKVLGDLSKILPQ